MFVLTFTYHYAGESNPHTGIHGYLHLDDAETIFDHLQLGYQFDTPLRVKGGKRIKIESVRLYSSFREDRVNAEAEVKNGGGSLIREAHEVEIDVE